MAGTIGRWNEPDLPPDLQNLDSAPDRRCNLLRVSHQIVCNGVLKWKIVWPNALVDIAEGETWKAVVPRGTVRHQRVPSFRAPALSDPVSLENEVRHAVHAQMFAHGDAGLPAAHDKCIYLLNRHVLLHRD
jgi:hypothetical protein